MSKIKWYSKLDDHIKLFKRFTKVGFDDCLEQEYEDYLLAYSYN